MRNYPAALAILVIFSVSNGHATERELASDKHVRITMRDSTTCAKKADVSIRAVSADYFDQSAEIIQKLVNTSSVILSFECPQLERLIFSGYSNGILVFKAVAAKQGKWALQSEPAPLEQLALIYSQYEPSYHNMSAAYELLLRYEGVPGIRKTFQFSALDKQAKRLSLAADGDVAEFRRHLTKVVEVSASLQQALEQSEITLAAIKTYAPDQRGLYEQEYRTFSERIKTNYWSERIAALISSTDSVAELFDGVEALAKNESTQFTSHADNYLSSWIAAETQAIQKELTEASIHDVSWAADFVAEFPTKTDSSKLPQAAKQLAVSADQIRQAVRARLEVFRSSAMTIIRESGSSYTEIEAILEASIALSQDFEDYDFLDQKDALTKETEAYIGTVLEDSLPAFVEELDETELNFTAVASLQEQARAYGELSAQFPGFASYKVAVEDALESRKEEICGSLLEANDVSSWHFEKVIHIGSEKWTLLDFACKLSEGGNSVVGFSGNWWPGSYTLTLADAKGSKSQFLLVADEWFFYENLRVVAEAGEQESPISEEQWVNFVADLSTLPPSGAPNDKGLRECDELAADPNDPNKLADGIDFDAGGIDSAHFDRALDACVAAVENAPDDPRQLYQLGRMLWHSGDPDRASDFMRLAAEKDYAAALYYQAQALLGDSGDRNAFVDAMEMFEKSGKLGYSPAKQMVNELNPDGIKFFREIAPPTERELVAGLTRREISQAMLGTQTSVQVVGAKIKECFQTSATDFSCEFKKILKCEISSPGNDPMIALMSRVLQADCNTAMYGFASFRKVSEGRWQELPSQF